MYPGDLNISNSTPGFVPEPVDKCQSKQCTNGLILPAWKDNEPGAGVLYLFAMAYVIFGINVVAEKLIATTHFMADQKKFSTVRLRSGIVTKVKIPFWSSTVAMYTFQTIGTSFPITLLPIIDVFKENFHLTAFGYLTLIGSAAFGFLVITAASLGTVPKMEPKAIKRVKLFATTSIVSMLAYTWLILVQRAISPHEVELWEAILTLVFYPLLVLSAWISDKSFFSSILPRQVTRAVSTISDFQENKAPSEYSSKEMSEDEEGDANYNPFKTTIEEFKRRDLIKARTNALFNDHPEKTHEEIEEMATIEVDGMEFGSRPHSAYRVRKSRNSGLINPTIPDIWHIKHNESAGNLTQTIGFPSGYYQFEVSTRTIHLQVRRCGSGIIHTRLTVDYETLPVSHVTHGKFKTTYGQVSFKPQHSNAVISFEADLQESHSFKVKMMNPVLSYVSPNEPSSIIPMAVTPIHGSVSGVRPLDLKRVVFDRDSCIVSLIDDNHSGMFQFENAEFPVPDNVGEAKIKVVRFKGFKGQVSVPYKIMPGTAKHGIDYTCKQAGYLSFSDKQSEAYISIRIIDKNRFGATYTFFVHLLPPEHVSSSGSASPSLGDPHVVQIGICETEEADAALDRLMKTPDLTARISALFWRDQLKDAFTANVQDNFTLTEKILNYVYVALAFPWKFSTALLPPQRFLNGWINYGCLLLFMILISVLLRDTVQQLDCTLGIKEGVSAILLIPAGIGFPDVLASRRAAIFERNADSALGNLISSHTVTTLLGFGVAFTLSAIYHTANETQSMFPIPQSVEYSVLLFMIFATLGVIALIVRRMAIAGGELGGNLLTTRLSGLVFAVLWVLFVMLNILEFYCITSGF